jgi:hypothetical protein
MLQEFVQQITDTAREVVQGVHTAIPGTIVSFDPCTCLATVLPSMSYRKPSGDTVAYPQVTGVPVVFPQVYGQQATIAYPVNAGDGCLIIVAEQSIDLWMYGQETDTDLSFDLSNSICIPGLFAKANPIMAEACGGNAIIVDVKGSRLTVKENLVQIDTTKVQVNASDTYINGNLTVSGGVINLN